MVSVDSVEMFENGGQMQGEGQGQTNLLGQIVSSTVLFSQYSPLLQVFPQLNDFLTVPPFKCIGDLILPCCNIGQG